MPVCKLVSVDYLNRTGKQGALIGILFYFKFIHNWREYSHFKRQAVGLAKWE